ncbi:PspC domain-containing protein [Rhodococcus ruber]|uniref:Phage shock protein PspC N-terminal domain-containing protein n=2 Tax=Rhodococcus ruber TaxID=1830 RepID=A0A098BKJ7_9NOCA|nr:PspC domain-containing protein [Rhodococcus ruber]MBP2212509.1 phage shock protein PspC (stress-responsive transcriptional regulator) [Rhodococcus ruber]MCD2128206.1 PspC domain-containing protein [Rhodococcus ruber]MCZ4505247.1 PspC domain-containing protein [Rhodococcus ruber]MCZ4531951.1 PspC domain-containing protein [Rhodococcus ruber]MCZ4622663.1 PspC domain-containing protein [Rhodococcus ruber]
MNTRSFPEQLSDMWRTRPVRLPRQGHVAGVCAGIGVRYDVDPVLIRVAFVVSTFFGGAGLVLYLAGWLLLPRYGDQVSPAESLVGRGQSSESSTKVVVLLVVLAVAASAFGPLGAGVGGSGFVSMVLMLGGLWLLYQRRPEPPVLPGAPQLFPQNPFQAPFQQSQYQQSQYQQAPFAQHTGAPGPAPADPDFWTKPEPESPRTGAQSPGPEPAPPQDPLLQRPTPPSWDPLGVAPFAWDLPEPTPTTAVVPAKQPRSRLTTTVLGLAVLAAAAAGAVASAGEVAWLTPARIGAIALAVIGLGLLVGAFLHRGYGLLVVTGPLLGFVVLASLVGPIDTSSWGEQLYSPRTAAELQPAYSVQMGALQLDLRGLELTEDETVSVETRFGATEILLPQNLDVDVVCTERASNPCTIQGLDGGDDGVGGPVLTLNLDTAFGNSEVRRG